VTGVERKARTMSKGKFEQCEERGINTAAHPGIVYGPDCGPDGVRV
jgi:hypothetical protein